VLFAAVFMTRQQARRALLARDEKVIAKSAVLRLD
jgi:hypothetical protein